VPVTKSAAAPAWVCPSGQWAPAAWRSRVKPDPDRRRAARQSGAARRDAVRGFVVPRRYPPLSCFTCCSREGAMGAFEVLAAISGIACAAVAACGVFGAESRTATLSGPAGGFVQPSCWTKLAIIYLTSTKFRGPCRDYLLGFLTVGLPGQGANDTNADCDQVTNERPRSSPFRLAFWCSFRLALLY
jgi:hypothetical protein